MLTVLVEFLVLHSSEFYAWIYGMTDATRLSRGLLLAGLGLAYTLFAVALALYFHEWHLVLSVVWLFGSRFAQLWTAPSDPSREAGRMFALWAISLVAYLGGFLAALVLPLPDLGLTPEAIAPLHMPEGWSTLPKTVIAFGVLYFVIQAIAKVVLSGKGREEEGGTETAGMGVDDRVG